MEIDEPVGDHQSVANTVLLNTALAPSRQIPIAEMQGALDRVQPPVRSASHLVCLELRRPVDRCRLMQTVKVALQPYDSDINSFINSSGEVVISGQAMASSGSDDEIAAILAHELAHLMLGHNERSRTNTVIGFSIGTSNRASVAIAHQLHIGNLPVETAPNSHSGSLNRAYQSEREIEADRIAIYVLDRAGLAPVALRDVLVRYHRIEHQLLQGESTDSVGYLQTHPSNDRRIAHIVSALSDLDSGVPLELR